MSKSTLSPKSPLNFEMSIGLIADEETTLSFLKVGVGEQSGLGKFDTDCFIVPEGISTFNLEKYFTTLYKRNDIQFILIGSNFYQRLYNLINQSTNPLPLILELPPTRVAHKQNLPLSDLLT